jgi:hypothetical protein
VRATAARPRALPRPAELLAAAPPDNALLTPKQIAAWFQVSERQVDRLDGIPWVTFGARSRRALVRSVLAWLETVQRRPQEPP